MSVQIEDLSFSYGATPVLHGVSIGAARPGEVREKLLEASARTLDRLLHPLRLQGARRSLTRPGTVLRARTGNVGAGGVLFPSVMPERGEFGASAAQRMSSFNDRQSGIAASSASRNKKKKKPVMSQDRRNDYDVTDTVQVSSPAAVRDAVHELYALAYPGVSFDKLWLAFHDFERLFTGRYPGYMGSAGWFTYDRRFAEWADKAGIGLDFAVSSDLETVPGLTAGYSLVLPNRRPAK